METLTTLKVIHITATVLLLLSGLVLAVLAWRKRSAGPAATVQRPWAFIWLLMGICLVSMPFTGWWLVHLLGWPLGQTWILGSSILYTVAALASIQAEVLVLAPPLNVAESDLWWAIELVVRTIQDRARRA